VQSEKIKLMNKDNQKNKYNNTVVNRLAEKYGVSKRLVQMSIKGDNKSETGISIKHDYDKGLQLVGMALQKL